MRYCCVPNCKTRWSKEVSLHSFPCDPNIRIQWKKRLGVKKDITKSMQVCYLHFKEEDFYRPDPTKKTFLKKGVIPIALSENNIQKEETKTTKICNPVRIQKANAEATRSLDSVAGKIVTNSIMSKKLKERFNNVQHNKGMSNRQKKPTKKRLQLSNKRKNLSPAAAYDRQLKRKKTSLVSTEEVSRKSIKNNYPLVPVILHGTVASEGNTKSPKGNYLSSSATPDKQYSSSDGSLIEIKDEPLDPYESIVSPFISDSDVSMKIHVPDFIDCESKPKQNECSVCLKKVLSREVCTYCPDCPDTPPLCLQPCFRVHHGY